MAKEAKVSIATVSRVLNGKGGYSSLTERKVQEAIKSTGYEPNAIARSLINKRTNSIGVLLPDISSMLASDILNGIENVAHGMKYSVIVSHTYSSTQKTLDYLKLLHEKRVDGIIFTSEIFRKEYFEYIKQMDIPVILLLTSSEEYEVASIKIDDYSAAFAATEYLISKGHKEIGMLIGDNSNTVTSQPRVNGFKKALLKNQISFSDNRIVYTNNYKYEDGKQSFKVLKTKFPEMTALFAGSDEIAVGAISASNEIGISIPDDLSIIGFDNLKISEMTVPPLTTIKQPIVNMGSKAMKMLIDLIKQNNMQTEKIVIPHEIIERASVKFIGLS